VKLECRQLYYVGDSPVATTCRMEQSKNTKATEIRRSTPRMPSGPYRGEYLSNVPEAELITALLMPSRSNGVADRFSSQIEQELLRRRRAA
jgi:hypothetical protein